jgi:eukaryotic-like serine/threonine-protein kinase
VRSPTTQEQSRWIGRILRDKWRIDARIARGGVGTVWAATHKNNGIHVAIKILHPEFARDEDTKSRFLQEGYAANQVSHPGVVRILDDDVSEEGQAFIVMELLEGELLEKRRVRKGGRLPLPEVYEIADQLLDVLVAAHEKGIVHRDIKPDNLFLTKEGKLKVLDFGFAQMKRGFRQEQTATGYLLGTPGFMSPEQAVGNRAKVDAQTDIWAVGATLFTLISGEPVHEGESAAEMLVAAANYQARPLGQVMPGVPPKLGQIVDKALAFEKNDRWSNARAMQAALRGVPGRVSVGASFESGRRSIPDEMPASFDDQTVMHQGAGAHDDDKTLMRTGVEELRSDEYDAVPSWQTNERTVAVGQVAVPQAALPSDFPPAVNEEFAVADRTMIMEGAPAQPPASAGAPPATQPLPHHAPFAGFGSNTPQAFAPQGQRQGSDPNLAPPGSTNDMMFVAGPARPAPPQAQEGGGSRALVFIAVALVSMVIVIVTGLIILAASD